MNWTSCAEYVDNVTSAVAVREAEQLAASPPHSEPAFFLFLSNIAEPGVCLFGIAGNVLNLIVLTRKQLQRSVRRVNYSALSVIICLFLVTSSKPADNAVVPV